MDWYDDWQDALEPVLEKLRTWSDTFVANLPNLAVAVLVAMFFGIVSKFVARVGGRLVRRLDASPAIVALTESIVRIGVALTGCVIALGVLGLDKTFYSMLAGAGVVGIALGFAFQDLAANLIAGVAMGVRKPFQVDDIVETNGYFGNVLKLNLRNTLVRTFDGQTVVIPNKEVFEKPLVNFSMSAKRRVDIDVGVAYETDLDQVVRVATEAVEGLDFRLEDEPVEVFAKEFGESSIDFSVRYWIDVRGDVIYPRAKSEAVLAIKRAFDEHGIEIPFPIRTLDLHRAPALETIVDDEPDPDETTDRRREEDVDGESAEEGLDDGDDAEAAE